MEKNIPTSAKVVVIGGGVAGCSVAYHLAKYGWKDTVLLERDQLTSGTTWHAAGLVGQLGASSTITRLRKYSLNLYKELEKKTGLSTGLSTGSVDCSGSVTSAGPGSPVFSFSDNNSDTVGLLFSGVSIINNKRFKKLNIYNYFFFQKYFLQQKNPLQFQINHELELH